MCCIKSKTYSYETDNIDEDKNKKGTVKRAIKQKLKFEG